MESIRTNLSVDNIKNLSNFKIKNSSITNNSKIKNINDISTSLIENIDVSLDNVDNREKIKIIDDLTEKYDLTEEQKNILIIFLILQLMDLIIFFQYLVRIRN